MLFRSRSTSSVFLLSFNYLDYIVSLKLAQDGKTNAQKWLWVAVSWVIRVQVLSACVKTHWIQLPQKGLRRSFTNNNSKNSTITTVSHFSFVVLQSKRTVSYWTDWKMGKLKDKDFSNFVKDQTVMKKRLGHSISRMAGPLGWSWCTVVSAGSWAPKSNPVRSLRRATVAQTVRTYRAS